MAQPPIYSYHQTGRRIVELPIETIESAAPTLLGIGPEIAVIEPTALATEIARLATMVLQRMKRQTQ